MQILLIMLIVVLLAFSVLLLALAKQSPREKQTEDKEQEEYIRDYAETVRQTAGSMKKLEHWKVIAIYLIIYDMIAVNFSYFMALLVRFDFRYSSIPTDYFVAWRSFAPIYGYANSEKIRDIVAAIVPTYHSADSDLKLHKKVYEELMSEAAVAAEKN